MAWNHNVHYHYLLLRAMPRPCSRALDVGCGQGDLARKMARSCDHVVAIDSDAASIAGAQALPQTSGNVTFILGDSCPSPFSNPVLTLWLLSQACTIYPFEQRWKDSPRFCARAGRLE